MKKIILMMSLLLVSSQFAYAANNDPLEIMRRVSDLDNGDSQYSRSVIATCRYQIKAGKMACAEKPRVKKMEGASKDYGKDGKDSRSINIILQPAAEKGIGFLAYDYDNPNRDSDQWMYLSAMGKVKRIVSGSDNEAKSGTMFGSEISYEDVEPTHVEDYVYKLVKEETFAGRPCWIIESRPKPHRARKSNYSRSVSWIDKERDLVLQSQLYDRSGRPIKHILFSGYEKVNGIWISKRMNVNNIQSRRITTMKTEQVIINPSVEDGLFKLRTLTDGAYREQQLRILRKGLQ